MPQLAWAKEAHTPTKSSRNSSTSGIILPTLVLDAGHGGRDSGAIGLSGTYEKHVVLDIVQEMAALLEKDMHVKLTRNSDKFLSLSDRVAIGREAQANLFISIHADSAPTPAARGLSAYTLSTKASDDFSSKLAAGENFVDQKYGAAVKGQEALADILYDLAAKQTVAASHYAQTAIIKGAGRNLPLLEQPSRAANFAVLRAPDVPALLIETGFLSNPADEAVLKDKRKRRRIAGILAREVKSIMGHALFK